MSNSMNAQTAMSGSKSFGELDEETCWTYLSGASVGRLAVRAEEGVDIFPINVKVKDRVIYFRSAPGSKLMDITRFPLVAVEVEGESLGSRWSIVVKGEAQRMSSDADIHASGVMNLETLTPTEKQNFVRILPNSVTGRKVVVV
jgi:nitroimidazol reductase NimA-like FMN-containing flavoprotein (pyridoxamine 5'-phosphate oxidase superfamily)